jgi:6,7-dimethyl-8-ribityllumazine synthase
MLRKNPTRRIAAQKGRFAIVASKFNPRYVDSMRRAAQAVLAQAKVSEVLVIRVPGSFEIPVVAAQLAAQTANPFAAILCLGVVMRGETTHAQHIAEAVSLTLAQLQIQSKVPIINGVYLFENHAQARVRCLDKTHNRGIELAQTALAMARVMATLKSHIPASCPAPP